MVNMKKLIRIVFVIFIANGIDCLGKVCDNCCDDCCDCFKDKDENITPESLVNVNWYESKKEKPVLMIFKKKDNVFTSTENENKISFELEGKDNIFKIKNQNEAEDPLNLAEDPLNLNEKKYALFEIKTKGKNTVYLYCSDVESSEYNDRVYGIFENMDHKSISAIACNTEKVTNMNSMFCGCEDLTKLDLKIFNTGNVTNIGNMFCVCKKLTKLDLENFNTKNVTDMEGMFFRCSKLKELNLESFNTKNVTNMEYMFQGCGSLKKINFGNNFNTEKVTKKVYMFYHCSNFPEDIRNKLENVEEVIKFFKEKNN